MLLVPRNPAGFRGERLTGLQGAALLKPRSQVLLASLSVYSESAFRFTRPDVLHQLLFLVRAPL